MSFAIALVTSTLLLQSAPQPAAVEQPQSTGILRFQQVDGKLYRGAQPDTAGLRLLQRLGITTVVNLRSERDAIRLDEKRLVESLGMRYVSLPIQDGNFFKRSHTVPEDTIRRFFTELDAATGPVFVHCHRGADRTGTLVALYRIARQGWTNLRAYEEARTLGMRSWYSGFKRQILGFRPAGESATVAHP